MFLESNREELEQNNWLGVWYIPGDKNTSYGLTKSLSTVNMRNLLARNVSRIATEARKKEIGKRIPSSKRYIAYSGTIQGERLWALTFYGRLARGGVLIDKWCWGGSVPIIQA